MPNWCFNNVSATIYIKKEKMSIFLDFMEELSENIKEGKLNEFICPLGQEWEYGLALETWGTKWDINLSHFEQDPCEESYHFNMNYDTAWSPNIPVSKGLYDRLCEFGEVEYEHSYDESGAAYYGKFDGIENECYDQDAWYRIQDFDLCSYDLNKFENNIFTFKDLEGFFIVKEFSKINCNYFKDKVVLDKYLCFSETYGEEIEIFKTENNEYYLPQLD